MFNYILKILFQKNEHSAGIYLNKIKQLEARVKDAEHQATEATKRVKTLNILFHSILYK